jgi:hypothetical protein
VPELPDARPRDFAFFAASVLVFAVALSAIAWTLPRDYYNPSDALAAIASASVILSARGARWPRRLAYAAVALAGYVLVDAAFMLSGMMHWAFAGLSVGDRAGSVAAVAFMFFAQLFPLAILVLFAGRNPSILWLPAEKPGHPSGGKRRRRG